MTAGEEIACLRAALKRQCDNVGWIVAESDGTIDWEQTRECWEVQSKTIRLIVDELHKLAPGVDL